MGALCLVHIFVHYFVSFKFLHGEDRADCFIIVLPMPCGCWYSVALPHGGVDLSAVCGCDILRSY